MKFKGGFGFYQLMEEETVSASKLVVVRNRATGKFVAGDVARNLVGLPVGRSASIKPGSAPEFDVFIQTKSSGRWLVPNTTFLYRAPARK